MFNPMDFLKVAEELSLSAQDEAKIRTSIGRAYFSAFLIAREWLKTKTCVFLNTGADHGIAKRGLRRHIDRTTGDMLGTLGRVNRSDADYDLTKILQQNDALDSINLAKVVIAKIQSVPASSPAPLP